MSDPQDERLLARAVFKTMNDQLDPPPYRLSNLGAGEERKLVEALTWKGKDNLHHYSSYMEITSSGYRFHPLVLEYFTRWGDRYLNGLRASRRLLQ